jgi:hypothetical protein
MHRVSTVVVLRLYGFARPCTVVVETRSIASLRWWHRVSTFLYVPVPPAAKVGGLLSVNGQRLTENGGTAAAVFLMNNFAPEARNTPEGCNINNPG